MPQLQPDLFGNMRGEGGKKNIQRLQDLPLVAFQVGQFVDAYHECRHRRVEREALDIASDLAYGVMEDLQFQPGWSPCGNVEISILIIKQPPVFLQETENSFDALGVPGLGQFYRTQEHLIHPQGIGAIFDNQVIGALHVVLGFRHFLDLPAADIFSIFQDEFGIFEIRPPLSESFRIENVIVDQFDIHMQRRGVVLVFQIV